jgi:o-succinylbenzoate synthase
MMIEQPLQFDDLFDHAVLQRNIQTPVCLDESIRSVDNVRVAREMGACRVINLKAGRVGGFASSLDIHDFAREAGIDLWCGGMYETGIGRLHNIALCSLPGFTLPTDTGPSDRYFARDIIEPPVRFVRPGYLEVERFCGVGDRVDWKLVDTVTIASETVEIGY